MYIQVASKHIKTAAIGSDTFNPLALALRDQGFERVRVASPIVSCLDAGKFREWFIPRESRDWLDVFNLGCSVRPWLCRLEESI